MKVFRVRAFYTLGLFVYGISKDWILDFVLDRNFLTELDLIVKLFLNIKHFWLVCHGFLRTGIDVCKPYIYLLVGRGTEIRVFVGRERDISTIFVRGSLTVRLDNLCLTLVFLCSLSLDYQGTNLIKGIVRIR